MRTLILALFLSGVAAAQCPNGNCPAVRVTVTLPAPRPAYVAAPLVYLDAPPVYLTAPRPVYRVYAAPVLVAPPIAGPWYLGKRADLRRLGWAP